MATTTVEFRSQTGSGGVTSDGQVVNPAGSATFATIRDTTYASTIVYASDAEAGIYLKASSTANRYSTASKAYFTFDTSSIPVDAVITGVRLRLYGYSAVYLLNSLGSADLYIVESTQTSSGTLSADDWLNYGSSVLGSIGFSSFVSGSYNNISLLTSSINVGGITKLCGVLDWFIDGFDGTWSSSKVTQYPIYMADAVGTSKDPILEVTYTTEDVSYEEENPVGEIINEFGLPVILTGSAGKKTFYYKVYNQGASLWDVDNFDIAHWDYSTDYVTTWTEDVLSEPNFTTEINGGAGAMYVRLKRDIAGFGEGLDIDLDNRVDVYVSDRQNPNGLLIYRGYINSYSPVIDEQSQYIEVELWSYVSRLEQMILEDASGNTEVAFASYDPANILKELIDRYKAMAGLGITYTADSIELTGTTVSYTFNLNTFRECFDKVVELCPNDWYFVVDADGVVHLGQSNLNVPDHKVTKGRDLQSLRVTKNLDGVVNNVYFAGGDGGSGRILKLTTSDGSETTWGMRARKIVDERVTLEGTASIMSERLLNEQSSPKTVVEISVVDTGRRSDGLGYDIETIGVGESIRVDNIDFQGSSISNWDVATFDVDVWDFTIQESQSQVLSILRTRYTPYTMYLTAGLKVPTITKRVEDIYRNMELSRTYDMPSIPT